MIFNNISVNKRSIDMKDEQIVISYHDGRVSIPNF